MERSDRVFESEFVRTCVGTASTAYFHGPCNECNVLRWDPREMKLADFDFDILLHTSCFPKL